MHFEALHLSLLIPDNQKKFAQLGQSVFLSLAILFAAFISFFAVTARFKLNFMLSL